jgi:hypothetical protein
MRDKTLKLVLTFYTTTAAMAMERLCADVHLPGRLIPVPREITAGCGMAWCAAPQDRQNLLNAAKSAGIQISGVYELML